MKRLCTKYLCATVLMLFSMVAMTQDEPNALSNSKSVSEEQYESLKSEVNFEKTKNAVRPKPNKKEKKKEENPKNHSNWKKVASLFELLGYIAIAAVIGFLIYFIFSSIKLDKKIDTKSESVALEEPENIEDLEIDQLISSAEAQKDFRLAIRYQFLKILQTLSKNDIIKWKLDKTNRDYNRELRGKEIGKSFQWASRLFEQIWYGKHDISQEAYQELSPRFIAINESIA